MLIQLTGGVSGNSVWVNPAHVVKVKPLRGEPVLEDQSRTSIVLVTWQVLSVAEDAETVAQRIKEYHAN